MNLRALAEVAVAATVAVAGGDRRRAEGAPVVTAFEGEHQAFAVAGVTHHFQRVLDRLRAADVEVHATVEAEFLLGVHRDHFRQLDLALVQVLAGDLRQGVDLLFQRVVQARVGVAEVDRRVPHLQVEVGLVFGVPHVGAFAAAENTRRLDVVNGVAVGAVLGFFIQKDLVFGGSDADIRHGGRVPDVSEEGEGGGVGGDALRQLREQRRHFGKAVEARMRECCWRSQYSARLPLANTKSAVEATHMSDLPSPITSTRLLRGVDLHLQLPDAARQASLE